MTDPKSTYGDPVEEPRADDDVVVRAEEGLADAEAARRDAVIDEPAPQPEPEPVPDPDPVHDTHVDPDTEPAAVAAPAHVDEEPEYTTAADYAAAYHGSTDTDAASPVASPSEPAYEPAAVAPVVAAAPVAQQPIFVQAPEAPQPRGNRAAAGAIGLLAALSFAVLYLAAWLGFGALAGDVTVANFAEVALGALADWSLWVTVVVFYLAFWLLGAIINRGRWGAWVIFGLLVGFASYGGHLLGQLLAAPFWMLTASEAAQLVEDQLYAPLAIAAFVIGRELTIWFGAWAATRGKRVTELNIEAQREYERTLEAGPQLVRQ